MALTTVTKVLASITTATKVLTSIKGNTCDIVEFAWA